MTYPVALSSAVPYSASKISQPDMSMSGSCTEGEGQQSLRVWQASSVTNRQCEVSMRDISSYHLEVLQEAPQLLEAVLEGRPGQEEAVVRLDPS